MRRRTIPWLSAACASWLVVGCVASTVPGAGDTSSRRSPPTHALSNADVVRILASALPALPDPSTFDDAQHPTSAAPDLPSASETDSRSEALTATSVLVEHPPFVVRLPVGEAASLSPYVIALLDRASVMLAARYQVTLAPPVRVEFFADAAAYRARLGGRLQFEVSGAYEAGTIMLLSPVGGGSAWGETLVHELSHAYQDRVLGAAPPRWLAEGLAEFDARSVRAEWKRESVGAAAGLLRALGPDLTDALENMFQRPRSARDLGDAYFLSMEFVESVLDRCGPGSASRLIESSAPSMQDSSASSVTPARWVCPGHSLAELEADFIRSRLAASTAAEGLLLPRLVAGQTTGLSSGERLALRASTLLVARRIDDARLAAEEALEVVPYDRLAIYVRVLTAILAEDRAAERWMHALLVDADAYEVRIGLARLAFERGAYDEANRECVAALALEPAGSEGLDLMLRLADRGVPGIDVDRIRRALFDVDERAADVGLEVVNSALRQRAWSTAREYGERMLYVAPQRPALHASLAHAYDALGERDLAARERSLATTLGDRAPQR